MLIVYPIEDVGNFSVIAAYKRGFCVCKLLLRSLEPILRILGFASILPNLVDLDLLFIVQCTRDR